MSVATQQKHPSLAEIVREVTDDGRRIAEFYLGVADGSLEGFEDRHRMSAARRLDKIAPGLVAEYLLKYANAQVRPSMRGSRFPMGRISPMKKEMPTAAIRPPADPTPSNAGSPSSYARRPATAAPSSTSWPASCMAPSSASSPTTAWKPPKSSPATSPIPPLP